MQSIFVEPGGWMTQAILVTRRSHGQGTEQLALPLLEMCWPVKLSSASTVTVEMTLDESGRGRVVVERDVQWPVQPQTVRLHLPAGAKVLPAVPSATVEFRL